MVAGVLAGGDTDSQSAIDQELEMPGIGLQVRHFFFLCITLGLEMSDTKVYEP